MPRSVTHFYTLITLLVAVSLIGCASVPARTTGNDPFQGMNRRVYRFNESIDRNALKPMATAYQHVTPNWMRTGVHNFFTHLGIPWTITNELLQGKPQLMAQDTCRFVLNTVVGIGGFIDVAGKLELDSHDEDFGQTLAVWGVPSGPFLILPLLGPSSLRDAAGLAPDYLARPTQQISLPWQTSTAINMLNLVQTREALLSVDDALKGVFDPYGVVRDVWLQRREYLIYDGNPPITEIKEENDSF